LQESNSLSGGKVWVVAKEKKEEYEVVRQEGELDQKL